MTYYRQNFKNAQIFAILRSIICMALFFYASLLSAQGTKTKGEKNQPAKTLLVLCATDTNSLEYITKLLSEINPEKKDQTHFLDTFFQRLTKAQKDQTQAVARLQESLKTYIDGDVIFLDGTRTNRSRLKRLSDSKTDEEIAKRVFLVLVWNEGMNTRYIQVHPNAGIKKKILKTYCSVYNIYGDSVWQCQTSVSSVSSSSATSTTEIEMFYESLADIGRQLFKKYTKYKWTPVDQQDENNK